LPALNLPGLGAFSSGLIVLALAFAAIWFVFSRWTQGYEWRLTGQNSLFARLGGVKTDDNYVTVMLVTGALAGLAGGLLVLAGPGRFVRGLGANYAWDGIMVAVVANNGLVATLLYGLFFAALQTGALGMELITAVPSEFILVVQALTVLVVVASRGRLTDWLGALAAQRRLTRPNESFDRRGLAK
jgi:simple sugar transport system permease protein